MQNLTGTILSPQSINISWQPPLSVQIVDYFIVISSLKSGEEFLHNTTHLTSIIISMLHPATTYNLSVAPRTAFGIQQLVSILVELPPDGKLHNSKTDISESLLLFQFHQVPQRMFMPWQLILEHLISHGGLH